MTGASAPMGKQASWSTPTRGSLRTRSARLHRRVADGSFAWRELKPPPTAPAHLGFVRSSSEIGPGSGSCSRRGSACRVPPPRFPGLSLTTGRCSSGNKAGPRRRRQETPLGGFGDNQRGTSQSARRRRRAPGAQPEWCWSSISGICVRGLETPPSREGRRVFPFRRRLVSARSSIGCEPAGRELRGRPRAGSVRPRRAPRVRRSGRSHAGRGHAHREPIRCSPGDPRAATNPRRHRPA